ncbi:MAG: hypothetical protein Q9168_001397 [Polycauliona sp. 1 TL-2023]
MFPSTIWRPFAASVTIALIVVHWMLSDVYPRGARPRGSKAVHRDPLEPIPNKIWQLYLGGRDIPEDYQKWIKSWEAKNPSYEHIVLDDEAGDEFVRRHYSHEPYVMNTYLGLGGTIFRCDYLRYLVLAAVGGIYADSDTNAIKPIDDWLPEYQYSQARAIVGLEWDILGRPELSPGIYLPVQFCQWALAFSPHHPLMERMVQAVTREMHDLAIAEGVSLPDLHPRRNEDVLFASGPVKWSQEVYAYLSLATGTEVTHRNFTGLAEPTLIGDVMIMPIRAFGTGMAASGGGTTNTPETLLRHLSVGAWKEKEGKMPEERKKGIQGGDPKAGAEGERAEKKSEREARKAIQEQLEKELVDTVV